MVFEACCSGDFNVGVSGQQGDILEGQVGWS